MTNEAEEEADRMLTKIDSSSCAGTSVPQQTTIDYYENIIASLKIRISAIRADIDAGRGEF